ncbi:MAG TPA: alpha/beta hydrolase-fold protein [bacterium]|jgi:enterochelin esterase family protein
MKLHGQLLIESLHSRCLEGNPLGDSAVREIPVYLPEGYDGTRDYPLLLVLAGFTGSGLSHLNWMPWGETMPQRIERLISEKRLPPCVAVFPDAFTRLGGSQYLNSSAVGDYEDHITGEVIPWVRATFRAGLKPEQTVIAGKSSGGFGAFVLAARHPDLFGWMIMHSGDCYFEYSLLPDFPATAGELQKAGGPQEFIRKIGQPGPMSKSYMQALNVTAMAACYSPNRESPWGFDYPFDLETAELREDVWLRWLAHDPVRMAQLSAVTENLHKLRGIYIECGMQDEFNLQWGARILVKKLRAAGLSIEHREFNAGHMQTHYRYDESLSWWGSRILVS